MSAAGRPDAAPAPAELAVELREAGLVRLVAAADGDALAATGLLGRGLADAGIPFHASVNRVPTVGATEAACTVGIGHDVGDRSLTGRCVSRAAYAVARELGGEPDPVLALAGIVAADAVPGDGDVLADATERGLVERRPGVAIPTDDVGDGLAHSTLVHASFSADADAAADLVAAATDGDDADGTELAAIVALSAVADAPARAAGAVERALRPLATDTPFATVGGFADVLEATARTEPGTAVALALGRGPRTAALDAWRSHAGAAHRAVRTAEPTRHHGVVVVRVDGPVETVARLVRDFRSPEPAVVVLGDDGVAALATTDRHAGKVTAAAATDAGGRGGGRPRSGYATGTDGEAFLAAVREAL